MTTVAEWFVNILSCYAALGMLFAIAFVTIGIGQVDPLAKGTGVGFRLIILPGVAGLWPMFLARWFKGGRHE